MGALQIIHKKKVFFALSIARKQGRGGSPMTATHSAHKKKGKATLFGALEKAPTR
jgi:hypothetical protein